MQYISLAPLPAVTVKRYMHDTYYSSIEKHSSHFLDYYFTVFSPLLMCNIAAAEYCRDMLLLFGFTRGYYGYFGFATGDSCCVLVFVSEIILLLLLPQSQSSRE